jgi:hypothetical protein
MEKPVKRPAVPRFSETNSLTAAPGPRSMLVVARKEPRNSNGSSEREDFISLEVRRYSNQTGKKGNLYTEQISDANLRGMPYE